MSILHHYKNGNYMVTLFSDGTKVRRTDDDEFIPAFAENCDVKITDCCDGGCPMCYEDCTPQGSHANLFNYPNMMKSLHQGTEMAINGNDLTNPFLPLFLSFLKTKGVIANLTVNQVHFEKYYDVICDYINKKYIYGLGVSLKEPTDEFIKKVRLLPNIVIHTINGIITPEQINKLADQNLKILVLGYKLLERGVNYYKNNYQTIKSNQKWLYDNLANIFKRFKCFSFDNLAIEQLDVKRIISEQEWKTFYMGDDGAFTFYIDLVEGTFCKNSLIPKDRRISIGDKTIDEMFQIVRNTNWS